MKKKICMIVPSFTAKGGISAVVDGYQNSQLTRDYYVKFVETYCDGGKLAKILKALSGYFKFAGLLLFWHPDIVHIHSSFGASFYRSLPIIYMASWAKKPVINHIHGADFDEFYVNTSNMWKKLIRNVYDKCAVLVALSAEWDKKLSRIVSANKITIIENYGTMHKNSYKEKLIYKSSKTILFLGEIGKRKGCYDIPAIAEKVVKKITNVKFILCGSGNSIDEMAIKKLIKRVGVINNIVFPGWIRGEEKDRLLREADVFLLPSYNEGMPMSVLDAMSYGLPIVSTNVGGIPKLVKNGINGYLSQPGDIESMASSIIELLQNRSLRTQMGQASVRIIKEDYSFDKHITKIEKLYQKVLQD